MDFRTNQLAVSQMSQFEAGRFAEFFIPIQNVTEN